MRILLAVLPLMLFAGTAQAEPLAFRIDAAGSIDAFYQDGPVAAHVVLTAAPSPRLVVAFPAGNSGVALWLAGAAAQWRLTSDPRPVSEGRFHGVTFEVGIDTPQLTVRQAALGNVRTLRDFEYTGQVPPPLAAASQVGPADISWARDRLDGRPGYRLRVEVLNGAVAGGAQPVLQATAPLRLRVTALTAETPLTPFAPEDLLTDAAAPDPMLRNILRFLSTREKFLAGSWRFNTYFGRDTLMSVRLLMPALQPQAIEAGLRAVLARLNAAGEVAHEEDVADYALWRRREAGEPLSDAPILDEKMIDDDFMLAPVAADYLLQAPDAAAFLHQTAPDGTPMGALLARNLRFVLGATQPFAQAPYWNALLALKPGEKAGDWRDSQEGLGGGRYSYSVNGVLAPAALYAAARLAENGLLTEFGIDTAFADAAKQAAAVWAREAPRLFRVQRPAAQALDEAKALAVSEGLPTDLPPLDRDVLFHAVALDGRGRPIPVMNSDEGFALLFLDPDADDLQAMLHSVMQHYPLGLMSEAGLLVANAAYATPGLQPLFDETRYHGAVVWSGQQALLAAGLKRQLARTDLPAEARLILRQAEADLWRVISATKDRQAAELWSWRYADGRFVAEPFGQRTGDKAESNAAQLWSTVYLAVRPPDAGR